MCFTTEVSQPSCKMLQVRTSWQTPAHSMYLQNACFPRHNSYWQHQKYKSKATTFKKQKLKVNRVRFGPPKSRLVRKSSDQFGSLIRGYGELHWMYPQIWNLRNILVMWCWYGRAGLFMDWTTVRFGFSGLDCPNFRLYCNSAHQCPRKPKVILFDPRFCIDIPRLRSDSTIFPFCTHNFPPFFYVDNLEVALFEDALFEFKVRFNVADRI